MAPRRVSIPFVMGVNTATDPKVSMPYGLLKSSNNLRIRKRNQLGPRNGFAALDMSTGDGTMVAYQLFEYKNRLCALGDDGGNGYPTEVFEYINQPQAAWRGTDPEKSRVMLPPFTNFRDVGGIPQAEGGVTKIDACLGQGRLCVVYTPADTSRTYAVILDPLTDQVLYTEELLALSGAFNEYKLIHVNGHFLLAFYKTDESIRVLQYSPLTDTGWTVHIASVDNPSAFPITAWDFAPVTNGSTAEMVVTYDRNGTPVEIVKFKPDGTQLGSTISVTPVGECVSIGIEADQVNDTINMVTVENTDDATLRTFAFAAGTLSVGPTIISGSGASAATVSICRLRAQGSFAESVGILYNLANLEDVGYAIATTAAHTQDGLPRLVEGAQARTKVLAAQTPGQPKGVVWGGLVAPALPSLDSATNVLFFSTRDVHHCAKRDYISALDRQITNLSYDPTIDKLCWPATVDPGVDSLGVPSIVIGDLQSPKKRQGARFGQHYYFSGGIPIIYDGRAVGEMGFGESPGILSVTSGTGGSLTPGAIYYYTVSWEYVWADKSVMLSPISVNTNPGDPFNGFKVTMGPSNTKNTLKVSVPHSMMTAAGDVLYGSNIVAVLSRTEWDPISNTARSVLRRCEVEAITPGIGFYGREATIVDTLSDVSLSVNEPIYTEGERGALSGPLEQEAPQPFSYITASESRLTIGGLIRSSDFQKSREAFLGESVCFSNFSQFRNQCDEEITAVQNQDGSTIIFTDNDLYSVGPNAPDDQGVGVVDYPIQIGSSGGLIDNDGWRSILKTQDGVFYHQSDEKLMMLPRGANSPMWAGEPAQDILAAFPEISGTCRLKKDLLGVFALTTATDARFLTLDFTQVQWLTETPILETDNGVDDVCEYLGKLSYISGGVVYYQTDDFADNGTDFIDTTLETQIIYPFGLGGKGLINDSIYVGQSKSDCVVTISVSYDDGLSFVPMVPLTTNEPVDGTLKIKFRPKIQHYSSIAFKVDVTGTVPGEGVLHNHIEMWVEDENNGLENLKPAYNISNAPI